MKTRERLIFEAFKLFASRPYDKVTFTSLEEVTGLSRGAILYYFKSKEILFNEIIENYVFSTSSVQSIDKKMRLSLYSFIISYINKLKIEQKKMAKIGINNVNLAMFNIENNAFNFYPNMQEHSRQWYENELMIWKEVIDNSIMSKEIRDFDSYFLSDLFEKIYIGISYLGITNSRGYDINKLKNDLLFIYNLVKI